MFKFISTFLFFIVTVVNCVAQVKVKSTAGSFDTLQSGTSIYYQFAWDDPLDEYPEILKMPNSLKAFNTVWDSMIVADGSVYLTSTANPFALLIVDATGWDIMDLGNVDTLEYPNLSPVTLSVNNDEIEWLNFGFFNELESLDTMVSIGSVKIKLKTANTVDLVYGDFAIVHPDLCFEGFGSLRPSVTYVDSSSNFSTWYIFGDPASPAIDTLSDTAFDHLPAIGQTINLDFNKTNALKVYSNSTLKIYPNPVTDIIHIQGNKDFTSSSFQIISMEGKAVMQGKLAGNDLNVDTLKTGNYIIRISSNHQTYLSRFIKQ